MHKSTYLSDKFSCLGISYLTNGWGMGQWGRKGMGAWLEKAIYIKYKYKRTRPISPCFTAVSLSVSDHNGWEASLSPSCPHLSDTCSPRHVRSITTPEGTGRQWPTGRPLGDNISSDGTSADIQSAVKRERWDAICHKWYMVFYCKFWPLQNIHPFSLT